MKTTYHTRKNGVSIRILNVPTTVDTSGEEVGFSLRIMRGLEALIAQAVDSASRGETAIELEYMPTA